MNFEDRLRNHLNEQNDNLSITPAGVDEVSSRSSQRKQRKAAGLAIATIAVVGAMLAFAASQGSGTTNFATEGASEGSTTSAPPADDSEAAVANAPEQLETAAPEPGAALVLTETNTADAPGGYNVYQSGRANDLYYVVSTAPGLTFEDIEGEPDGYRPDTIYTFDGSNWSTAAPTDRFVSGLVGSDDVLYAISTGTKTEQSLSVGSSTNAGGDWNWTPIDLSTAFGSDTSAWPFYQVQQTANGDQRLVVISGNNWVELDDAVELAKTSNRPIADIENIAFADQEGISWFGEPDEPQEPPSVFANCVAIINEFDEDFSVEEEIPEHLFKSELTPDEQAELDAWIEAEEALYAERSAQILEALQEEEGCEPLAACEAHSAALNEAMQDASDALAEEWGIDLNGEEGGADLTSEQYDELDAVFERIYEEQGAPYEDPNCDAVYEEVFNEDVFDEENLEYATWDELGVVFPDELKPIRAAFLVDGGEAGSAEVTALNDIFDGASGYVVDVSYSGDAWRVVVEDSIGPAIDQAPEYTEFASVDGIDWTSSALDSFSFRSVQPLPDGSTFSIDWQESDEDFESSRLLRTDASGASAVLLLNDLAPGIDVDGYQLVNVKSGDYGVVAWAIDWSSAASSFDSILLYSPDGISWGVTEISNQEIVDVVVGADDVLIFTNDPNRPEGSPQPVLIGKA